MKQLLLSVVALSGLMIADGSSAQAQWGVNVNVGSPVGVGCAPGAYYAPAYTGVGYGYYAPRTSWVGPGYGSWNYNRGYYGSNYHYGHHHHGGHRW